MDILEQFKKSRERKPEQEIGTPPSRGMTLAEILKDKNSFHLFGKVLKKDGQEDLARRIIEGKLEESDIELLEEERLKFAEKIARSEKIEGLLTEETVTEIARQHPTFARIANILGPQKAIRAIRSQLKEICITDEDRFNWIATPLEAYNNYKNVEGKEVGDKVEKLCKDMGIQPKEYLDAVAIENPKEKEKALRTLARGQHDSFETILNVVIGKERKNLRSLKDSEILLEDSIAELDGYKNAIGSVLFLSVSGNEDMRNALTRELVSEDAPEEEARAGFSDVKKETNNFDEGKFDKDWEAFKVKMAYDTSTDFEKGWVQGMFLDEQKELHKKQTAKNTKNKGFWASVIMSMFEKKIESKINTLK